LKDGDRVEVEVEMKDETLIIKKAKSWKGEIPLYLSENDRENLNVQVVTASEGCRVFCGF
jgi:bifunctional DNA-binding transcriptional regulator/antitoxin component of YhaV-PrlF toxin-antitoxin module